MIRSGLDTTGKRLRFARLAAGIESQAAAVARFNWSKDTLKSAENDTRGLTLKSVQKYARAYKCSAAWLLTGDGPAPGEKSASVQELDRELLHSIMTESINVARTSGAEISKDVMSDIGMSAYTKFLGKPTNSAEIREELQRMAELILAASPKITAARKP